MKRGLEIIGAIIVIVAIILGLGLVGTADREQEELQTGAIEAEEMTPFSAIAKAAVGIILMMLAGGAIIVIARKIGENLRKKARLRAYFGDDSDVTYDPEEEVITIKKRE